MIRRYHVKYTLSQVSVARFPFSQPISVADIPLFLNDGEYLMILNVRHGQTKPASHFQKATGDDTGSNDKCRFCALQLAS